MKETPLNVTWQPGGEGNLGKNEYKHNVWLDCSNHNLIDYTPISNKVFLKISKQIPDVQKIQEIINDYCSKPLRFWGGNTYSHSD